MRRRIASRLFGEPVEVVLAREARSPAIAPSQVPHRRRLLHAAALIATIVAVITVGARLHRPPRAPCPDAQAQLGHAWAAEQRQAVRATFAASDLPYSAATHARIEPALDAYATRWTAARRDTCEAQQQRDASHRYDDSARCLDDARVALSTRVRVLAAADRAIVADADAIVAGLPAPEQCRDPHARATQRHHERTADPAITADLDRARVHIQLRQGHQAVAALTDVLARLHAAGDTIGEAEALLLLARTQAHALRDPAAALRSLDQAHDRATDADRHELSRDIWTERAWIRAAELGDPGEARRLLDHARRTLQSRPTADPRHAAAIESVEATILALEARHDEAVTLRRTIVDTLRRELADTHPDVLAARAQLADTLSRAGASLAARRARHDLLALIQQTYGADHPLAARIELELGRELVALADLPAARVHLEHARDALAATYGQASTIVVDADVALAELARAIEAAAASPARDRSLRAPVSPPHAPPV